MGIYTNTDFARRVTLRSAANREPVNLDGFTLTMTVKALRSDAEAALVLSPAIVDAAGGVFEIRMTAAQTAALAPGDYAFDVVRTDNGQRVRLMGGRLVVKRGVS